MDGEILLKVRNFHILFTQSNAELVLLAAVATKSFVISPKILVNYMLRNEV